MSPPASPRLLPDLTQGLSERIANADPAPLAGRLTLLQVNPNTAAEAFLWRGLHALKHQRPHAALLFLANALARRPRDPLLLQLLARAAREQHQPDLAQQWDTRARAHQPDLTPEAAQALALDSTAAASAPPPDAAERSDPAPPPVDVIIPVYRGHEATCDCLRSVIAARPQHRTAHEILVLDDASPEPALVAELLEWARAGAITLIRHSRNLGFIRSMNHAMARHPERDLVWLNADTRVHADWLDRLRAHAYREPRIASVTPLSNHGELTSFPAPGQCAAYPSATQSEALDRLAREHNPALSVPLEIGCGFCFYVRRAALNDLGGLDERTLSGGYGEDTDWCARATARGWQHRAAVDVFVAHRGSVSFGARKAQLAARNNAILAHRYPRLQGAVAAYRRRDPLAPARRRIQRARRAELIAWIRQAPHPAPALGAEAPHPSQLQILAPPGFHHPLVPFFRPKPGVAWQPPHVPEQVLWLTWARPPAGLTLTLGAATPGVPIEYDFPPGEFAELLAELRQLPLTGLVYHQGRTCPEPLMRLPQHLGLPYALRPLDGPPSLPAPHPAWIAQAVPPPPPAALLQAAPWSAEALEQHPLIIADGLDDRLGPRWLALARRRAQAGHAAPLVLVQPGPWHAPLRATGQVVDLPALDGLTPAENARLARLRVAVSLDDHPDPHWLAPVVARRLDVPLLAPPSTPAQQLGAADLPTTWYRHHTMTATTDPAVPPAARPRTFLNLGCGQDNPQRRPEALRGSDWQQIRLDIDPNVAPDILASAHDLSAIADASFDAVFSSHSFEHLDSHQIPKALAEIHRVLKADGFALITLPDLHAIAERIVAGRLTDTAYESPIGPISALDMLFGHGASIAKGNAFMAHRTGFDAERLGQSLLAAGFAEVRVRKGPCYDLWAWACKTDCRMG